MDVRKTLCSAFASLALGFASHAQSAVFTSLNVFGDSLLDSGNALVLNLATPGPGVALGFLVPTSPLAPPYPPNATQYTNPGGSVAVEVLANRLGLPLAPSELGGTNFAIGGATAGFLNFVGDGAILPPNIPFYPGLAGQGIRTEVANFAAAVGGAGADPTGLYVVWGGANDIFLNQALSQPQNPVMSVTDLAAAIGDLYNLGARTIIVPNLPDLGRSPAFVGQPGAAGATALTVTFNALLAGAILNLEGSLPGLDILPFDTFAVFDEVLSNLSAFGLADATTPCYLLGAACDPTTFLFWDFVHPTSAGHQILGERFFGLVAPEPGSIALIGFGALLLTGFSRARMTGA